MKKKRRDKCTVEELHIWRKVEFKMRKRHRTGFEKCGR